MSLAGAVKKLSLPQVVTRRAELTYDGSSPFPVAAPAETEKTVSLHMQRGTGTSLDRTATGDESTGSARVWVTNKALAAVGWTELLIAPPEDTDGPPGDWIDWDGRRWEITEFQGWEVSFSGNAGFKRYVATDRGPTP